MRFNREAPTVLGASDGGSQTLGEFLELTIDFRDRPSMLFDIGAVVAGRRAGTNS